MREEGAKHGEAYGFLTKLLGFSLSSYLSAVLTFAASYINTRFFSEELMGQISIFYTVQSFMMYMAYMGADQSFCRYYFDYQESERKQLLNRCVSVSMATTAILAMIASVFWSPLSGYIVGHPSIWVVAALIISVFVQVIWRYLTLLQRMNQQIVLYTILMILHTLCSKLSFTGASFISKDAVFSIGVIAVSSLLTTLGFVLVQRRQIGRISFRLELRSKLTRQIVRFGAPLMPVTLMSWLNASIPTLLIGHMRTYGEVGVYSATVTLTSIVSLLLGGFTTFWVPFYYEHYKSAQSRIQTVHSMICFALVAFGLILILLKDLIFLIVGENFRAGSAIFSLLLMSPICYGISETTGIGISISEKSYLNVFVYATGIAVNAGLSMFLLPSLGLSGAGIAVAVSSIAALAVKTIIGEKHYRCIRYYWKTASVVGILMFCVAWDCCMENQPLRVAGVAAAMITLCTVNRKELKRLLVLASDVFKQRRIAR